MSQDYKLVSFKPSDYKDSFGNTWCDIALEGISEPVKWVVKDPSKAVVGQTYYGRIEDKTSKADKPYRRFYVEKKEEPTYQKTEQGDEYWAERNNAIKAQFAIKTAVELLKNPYATDIAEELIESWAKKFFNMVERVATDKPEKKDVVIDEFDDNEPINLDDIPF